MWNALFSFEDAARADDATQALLATGFPKDGVNIHRRASGARGGAVEQADEQVTGGVLSNLFNLFQGVFDWGNSPHADAPSYEAVVNRGGTVLEIRAGETDRVAVNRVLIPMSDQHTQWQDEAR